MKPYIGVKTVIVLDNYMLRLTFTNGEQGIFDMKPYLNKGIFKELKDVKLFSTAHISFDTVEWDNEADFDPEVLYSGSKKNKSIADSNYAILAETKVQYKRTKG